MKPLYEIEIQRTNISPRSFFTYCANQMKKHGADMEIWADYDSWANENQAPERIDVLHEDWDEPCREFIADAPYETQRYLSGAYNFILEFEFDTDKKGHGYCYAVEFEG